MRYCRKVREALHWFIMYDQAPIFFIAWSCSYHLIHCIIDKELSLRVFCWVSDLRIFRSSRLTSDSWFTGKWCVSVELLSCAIGWFSSKDFFSKSMRRFVYITNSALIYCISSTCYFFFNYFNFRIFERWFSSSVLCYHLIFAWNKLKRCYLCELILRDFSVLNELLCWIVGRELKLRKECLFTGTHYLPQ